MSETLGFTFEGRAVRARAGQSLGAALLAAGVDRLGRSARFRRPRGLRCCRGACPCCQLRVDGLPGVLACMTPVRGGEVVEREEPAGGRLLRAPAERVAGAGFFHASWLGRAEVWRRAEPALATLAGVSRPPLPEAGRIGGVEERDVDVLVVGAGEGGLLRAAAAAQLGAGVLVVERDFAPGGRLLDEPGGAARAAALAARATAAGAELRLGATALGADADGLWGVVDDAGLTLLRAGRVVLATGTWDRELALPDGDRPGVLLAGAVRRLVVREGVVPGRRAVIVASAAADPGLPGLLRDVGIGVVAVVGPEDVRGIAGGERVRGVRLASGRVACDLVVVDAGRRPADELGRQDALRDRSAGDVA